MPGLPVEIYECQVRGVHEDDRVIDAVSRTGALFQGVSYLLPWISADGSGIDFVPKVGDQCLILASAVPRANPRGAPFPGQVERGRYVICIGFKLPVTKGAAGLCLGGRLAGLPQGSMGFRAVSEDGNEALLLLTRGGTAIIGANEGCRTLYSPVDSSIIHIFNNWELNGPGGHIKWTRVSGQGHVQYEAEYRTEAIAEQSAMRVNVNIGVDDANPVDVTVSTGPGARPYLRVRVSSSGEAFIEGEIINIVGRAGVNIDGAEVKIKNRQVLGQGDPI